MATSVRTKAQKKQPAFDADPHEDYARRLEQAVMELEDTIYSVLNIDKGYAFHDVDFLYWNRRLKNVAMQVSMALGEYRGVRRFHYHYRHDAKNPDTLYPVAGPAPLLTLVRICREALTDCADMTGMTDEVVLRSRDRLEQALRFFLHRYPFRATAKH